MFSAFPGSRLRSLFAAAVLAAGAITSTADAQVLYGSLVGNITDPSHGAIPNAAVKIVNKGTAQEWSLTTNEIGAFSISTIPPGAYDVTISASGFQNAVREGVIVAANNVVRVDVALSVGAITETVRVRADVAVLQTDTADVRQEIRA